MLRRLYDRVLALAGHPHAVWALAGISFAESSFFPIPPDLLLIPLVLADRSRAFKLAAVCTLASVLGGFLGYAIGYYLWEGLGHRIFDAYGLMPTYERLRGEFDAYGAQIIIAKGMTPIPYKLITIASGALHFNLLTFAGASVVSRALRFFLVAGLLWKFGEPIRTFIEKRLTLVTTLALVLVVAGFVVLKYLH